MIIIEMPALTPITSMGRLKKRGSSGPRAFGSQIDPNAFHNRWLVVAACAIMMP
jgi:hypothetical protein